MDMSRYLAPRAAPVGALSLFFMCLTAVCFPLVALSSVFKALLVVCGFTFTPALTCSVYSIAREKSKLFGTLAAMLFGLTVWFERDTLYFVEMGILLVPVTLVVMMLIAKHRATKQSA